MNPIIPHNNPINLSTDNPTAHIRSGSMNQAAEKTAAKVSSWATFGNIFAAIGDTFAAIRNTFSKTVTVAKMIGDCASSVQETASRLAQGAAKNVFKLADQVSEGLVYLTGRWGKVTEIQEEFKTGAAILEDLSTISKGQITDDNCGLALMSQSTDIKIRGKETWTMKAAIGDLRDLQKHFEKAKLSETDAAIQMGNIIEDITNGMANLHKAGYVHGDMKPDNILIYKEEKEGKITFHAKISDFGKTRKLDEKKSIVNAGNPRFVPPEGQITSMKGEDAVVALIIVDLLSKPYVKEDANFGVPADLKEVKIREGLKGIMGVWCKKTRAIDNKEGLGQLRRGIAMIQTQKELKSESSLSNTDTQVASQVAKDFIEALKLKMKDDKNQPDWLKKDDFFAFLTKQLGDPESRLDSKKALEKVKELKSPKVAPPESIYNVLVRQVDNKNQKDFLTQLVDKEKPIGYAERVQFKLDSGENQERIYVKKMDTAIGNEPPHTYYVVKPVQDPKNPLLKYEVVHHSDQNKTIGASEFKCAPKRYTLEQLKNLPKIIEAKQKLNFEDNQSFSYSLPDQRDFEEKMRLPKNQMGSRGG